MKTMLKFAAVALIVMMLAVPVSAEKASPSAGVAGPAVAPNLVDWYENWDAYPTGQNMHGIGGWKGWFNTPAATAYTSDVQKISVPNSIDIHGDSDLVHEYAIDSGVWTYTAWQYVPTSFSGTTYFILLNDYDDGGVSVNWSIEVQFDSASNSVINDGPDGGVLAMVKGQWVELRVEIDLDADLVEFYYGDALLFAGQWSEAMSGGGLTSIAAVDLFANGASAVYYDDLSLVEFSAEEPMHIGNMWGSARLDPFGRSLLSLRVVVHNANHGPLGDVAIDGTFYPPEGGAISRTRMTHPLSGSARFHWGSGSGGTWQFCVDDLTLAGFVYVPAGNDVPDCGTWSN